MVVILRDVSLPASGTGFAGEPSETAPAIGPVVISVQPAGRAPATMAQSPRAARKSFAAVPGGAARKVDLSGVEVAAILAMVRLV